MTQPCKIFSLAVFVAAVLLLPGRAAAQSATVTDDAFLSGNSTTQKLNLGGQGISLIVAGSTAAVGTAQVGTTTTYIKFQLTSSLPPSVAAANVEKATLKLFLSPATSPTGAIDIYPVTSAWTESTLTSSSPPPLATTPFASDVILGSANSFLIVDVTQLVQEWLSGTANGGIANDGIALVAHTSSSYAVFDSKESIVTSHEPRLEIVLANTGPAGAAATVQVGSTTTVGAGGQAAVTNSGTLNAAILNFAIPQGQPGATGQTGPPGAPGAAATVQVGAAMTVPAGTPASVLNGGTTSAAVLNFLIPQGPIGLTGAQGPQGPIGISNRGQWTSAMAYSPNDAVFDSASYWLATAANTGSEPSPTNANWQLLAAGINNRGAWSASNSYNVNDAVTDAGSYWLALAPTSASSATPNTSCEPSLAACASDWQLLAAQGAQGQTGAAGPQGPAGPPGPASAITGITAGTDLTGGGTTGAVTLNLNTVATDARYAQLGVGNVFAAGQTVIGDLSLSGSISVGNSLSLIRPPKPGTSPLTWFNVDSVGNVTNVGNTTTSGILRSENGGLSLGVLAPLSVDAPGMPGGRFTVLPNGTVGVGTPTPSTLYMLDVGGNGHIGGNNFRVEGGISAGAQYAVSVDAFEGVASQFQTPTLVPGGRFIILPNGNVGINNPNPQNILDVAGNVNVAASGSATGSIAAAGDIATNGHVIANSDIATNGRVIAGGGLIGRCGLGAPLVVGISLVTCTAFDVAETLSSLEPTEPGDVLIPGDSSGSGPTVRKSVRPYDDSLLGVVSTSPGLVLDGVEAHLAGDTTKFISRNKTVVALAGRVPVKVSMENGPVQIGDPLTSSSTPGNAMKATHAAKILGYALESMSTGGKVLMFVQPGYYIPPQQLTLLNQIGELQTYLIKLQSLKTQADTVELLKARLEKLERAVGSQIVVAKEEVESPLARKP